MDDYENTFATIDQYHQISYSPSTTHHQRSIVTKLNNKKKKVIKKKRGTGGGGFAGALKDLQMKSFRYSGTIKPGVQTPQKVVAEGDVITLPDYAGDGIPKNVPRLLPWVIEVKKPDEIEKMRAAGKVAREVLDAAGRIVKPGK